MAVRIVTDSSADLPRELVEQLGIVVVPLTVRFGDEEFVDGYDLSPREFWSRCSRSAVLPETAAPLPGLFAETYEKLAAEGADEIVSLHISAKLSGTIQSAETARLEVDVPVTTFDTASVSAGQGVLVRVAARMAASGCPATEVLATLEAKRGRLELHACLDTLEYLRKGGRIGGARALLGSMLGVKPLITMESGAVTAEGRVRTRGKALVSLVECMKTHAPVEGVAVMHGSAPDLEEFLEMLEPQTMGDVVVSEVGAVVGTHVGPGAIGVAYLRGAPVRG